MCYHARFVETRRKICTLTLKGQCQNMTSGQGHVRSRGESSRSCCISVEVSVRGKRIGDISSALSVFYQKLDAKTNLASYDLE